MSASPSRVAVFGAGYVGLVTGACLAELGHTVVVRDVLADRVAALKRGEVPIYEPGLAELIGQNAERLTFTTDVSEAIDGADIVYIAVGTPPTYSGDADLTAVWTVIDELPAIDRQCIVVMKSTVPVGTGLKVRQRLDQRGLENVGYVSNPEFTAEGTAVADFMHPDRIVIGAFRDDDGDAVAALHGGVDGPVVRCDVASAEMIKLAANAALMTRISFINEIANVCEATGADVVRVAEGIGLDRRIGPSFLRAGIGFGGSCFPKDSLALKQLAANSGYHFQLLNAVIEVNELQKRRVIGKLHRHLGSLRDKRVVLLGLAFKPHTDDMREAPSLVLAGRLLAEGAEVRAWDPVVDGSDLHGVEIAATPEAAAADADAIVIVTEWPELAELDWVAVGATMRTRVLIDGRNMLDPQSLRQAGLTYEGIGRAADREPDVIEAIVLAGGKAERLGDAAAGRPKSLVEVGGKPLLAWQIGRLRRAGVGRVIVGCFAGDERQFEESLAGLGVEIACAGEPERLGRGGAIRFAATFREDDGDVLAMNGDELVDVDFDGLLQRHRATGAAATVTVAQPPSQFGQVDLTDDDHVTGFHEVSKVPYWVNCGIYVLTPAAVSRFPERGDHETTIFPELAAEGSLRAFRHAGLWLTVNTPKELRRADEHVTLHPDWLA